MTLFFWLRNLICPVDLVLPYVRPEGSVLDLGCGPGVFATAYATHFPHLSVTGIDTNVKRIASARRTGSGLDNLKFLAGDAREVLKGRSFSTITLIDVLHHIPREHQEEILFWAYDHLSPGGRLIVKDIGDQPRWKRWATQAHDFFTYFSQPKFFFSPRWLSETLAKRGIRPTETLERPVYYLPHILCIVDKP